MKIRAAERADYEELAKLWSTVYPDDRYSAWSEPHLPDRRQSHLSGSGY